MASNKKDLRNWVRYDGLGRIVPGSNILARKKPKVGHWEPTQTYECCDPYISTTTSTTEPGEIFVFPTTTSTTVRGQ